MGKDAGTAYHYIPPGNVPWLYIMLLTLDTEYHILHMLSLLPYVVKDSYVDLNQMNCFSCHFKTFVIPQSSFGGKATTLVIGCVSPASLDFDETLNSLRFLTRIRSITNTPVMNRAADSNDHELIAEVTSEEQYTDVLDSEERSTNADTFGYVASLLF
jgi:hypothetical protein